MRFRFDVAVGTGWRAWWLSMGIGLIVLSTAPVRAVASTEAFLQQHWQRPLAAQGAVPDGYTAQEAALEPSACGSCHAEQLADWSTSLHSQAMGPGLMGQLLDMAPHARGEQQACLRCHAPLAEQADSLVAELTQLAAAVDGAETEADASAVNTSELNTSGQLHRQGLVCAACHVRQHQRFGPPRQDGSHPDPAQPLPHNGWTASRAFQDSRFCAACHQFEPGEFALNGKLLENTYEEWRVSRYAAEGVSCQQCHMPQRRHQWRGIHDPAMVRSGVSIEADAPRLSADEIHAQLRMTNSGTGHRFPTYVTPQVVMHGYQQTAAGERLAGTDSYFVVARRVALNLSAEIFDTRLAPDETARLDYRMARHPDAQQLVFQVWVEPDTFYQLFYSSVLQSGQAVQGRELLQQALEAAEASRFTLYETRFPL